MVVYSELCNTDRTVYESYLQTCRDVAACVGVIAFAEERVDGVRCGGDTAVAVSSGADSSVRGGCRGRDDLESVSGSASGALVASSNRWWPAVRAGSASDASVVVSDALVAGVSDAQSVVQRVHESVHGSRYVCQDNEVGLSEDQCGSGGSSVDDQCERRTVGRVVDDSKVCTGLGGERVHSGRAVLLGPNGGTSIGRGTNYARNQEQRDAKKARKRGVKLGASCSPLEVIPDKGVGSEKELSTSDKLKRSFDERRIAENELATQRARYNIRRNEYMQKSRVSEQKWETERLTSDEKLRKISEARLGASPGFAKTIVEEGLASPSVPSLSDGTVSPNSSISVEEVQKMNATIEKLAGKVAELEMVNKKLVSFASNGVGSCSGDEDEDEEDPRDKGKPYLVLRGECVPRKGEYRFKTEQFRNGNKVMAIDGKIVELNWKGKPARYIGGVEDITMPSEKDPYENLVNYDGYIPPMF